MAQEMLEERELGMGQRQRARAAPGSTASRIEDEIPKAEMVRRRGAAKERAHAREELLVCERLDQVVIRAAVEASDTLFRATQRGEQKNRKLGGRPQAPANRDAVEAGQHDVEDHKIRGPLTRAAQGVSTVARHRDVVALSGQHPFQGGGEPYIVLDDEN